MSKTYYAYSFSGYGVGWRMILPDWELLDGEVLFDHQPTEIELAEAFPNFVPQAWRDLQSAAFVELRATDMTAVRCVKGNIPFPQEWSSYVEALRTIVKTHSGDVNTTLPVRPDYPAGT